MASECGVVGLARADTDDTIDVGDEDFAVADFAGLGRFDDRIDHLIDEIAAPSIELRSTRRNELPTVWPYPASKGSAMNFA